MPSTTSGQPRPARSRILFLGLGYLGGLALGFVLVVAAGIAYFFAAGGPVANEWDCMYDEFPADRAEGGTRCLKLGDEVPAGWTARPGGNQPLGGLR